MIGSLDLQKAIFDAWNASNLNTIFKAYWRTADTTEFFVLNLQEARPAQPFPYCVLKIEEGNTKVKTTGKEARGRREIRDIPIEFAIYARQFQGISKSAMKVAGELADEVVKVFGGHPEQTQSSLTLGTGAVLATTYLSDFGVREGDHDHCWHVKYQISVDVPVAA